MHPGCRSVRPPEQVAALLRSRAQSQHVVARRRKVFQLAGRPLIPFRLRPVPHSPGTSLPPKFAAESLTASQHSRLRSNPAASGETGTRSQVFLRGSGSSRSHLHLSRQSRPAESFRCLPPPALPKGAEALTFPPRTLLSRPPFHPPIPQTTLPSGPAAPHRQTHQKTFSTRSPQVPIPTLLNIHRTADLPHSHPKVSISPVFPSPFPFPPSPTLLSLPPVSSLPPPLRGKSSQSDLR